MTDDPSSTPTVISKLQRPKVFAAVLLLGIISIFPFPWISLLDASAQPPGRFFYLFWGVCIGIVIVGCVILFRMAFSRSPENRGPQSWAARIVLMLAINFPILLMIVAFLAPGIFRTDTGGVGTIIVLLLPFVAFAWLVALLLPARVTALPPTPRRETDAAIIEDRELRDRGIVDER